MDTLMSDAIKIANYVHHLYDSKVDPSSETWYHGHFVGGVNPFYNQTKDCLIIEEYYHIPVSKIWTPLGQLHVSGSGCGDHKKVKDLIHKYLGLRLICPGYQTKNGFYGSYWLVVSIDGKEITHPPIENLLPHTDDITKTITNNDTEIFAHLKPYLVQLRSFEKEQENYLKYEETNRIFDNYIGEWIKSGLLEDPTEEKVLSRMVDDNDLYEQYLPMLLSHVKESSVKYVSTQRNKNQVLFHLIYYIREHQHDKK